MPIGLLCLLQGLADLFPSATNPCPRTYSRHLAYQTIAYGQVQCSKLPWGLGKASFLSGGFQAITQPERTFRKKHQPSNRDTELNPACGKNLNPPAPQARKAYYQKTRALPKLMTKGGCAKLSKFHACALTGTCSDPGTCHVV